MKLTYAGVGALSKKEPLDLAAQDYAGRLEHYVRFELKLLDAGARKNAPDPVVQKDEAERLLKCAAPNALRISLDEHGKLLTTVQLADMLSRWMQGGRDVVIFQGGATGLEAGLLKSCASSWSLSPLTLPHRMARVVALEALYRAATLLKGEPYHRA